MIGQNNLIYLNSRPIINIEKCAVWDYKVLTKQTSNHRFRYHASHAKILKRRWVDQNSWLNHIKWVTLSSSKSAWWYFHSLNWVKVKNVSSLTESIIFFKYTGFYLITLVVWHVDRPSVLSEIIVKYGVLNLDIRVACWVYYSSIVSISSLENRSWYSQIIPR